VVMFTLCSLRIHTGLVVVGAMGGGDRQEQLALGETPNIAARLQGLAAPDTAVLSAPTYRLVEGFFACHDLGARALTGGVLVTEVSPVASAPQWIDGTGRRHAIGVREAECDPGVLPTTSCCWGLQEQGDRLRT
jgi:hypothetical protein